MGDPENKSRGPSYYERMENLRLEKEYEARRDRELAEQIASDKKLLAHFNAQPWGWDPGITMYIGAKRNVVDLDKTGWTWLKPLLQELVELRAKNRQ